MTEQDRVCAAVVACFGAALYLAVIVAAFGMLALFTGADVISDPSIGAFVGPIMTASAVAALLVFLLVLGSRYDGRTQRLSLLSALGSGVLCFFVYICAGAVAGGLGDPHDALRYVLFAVERIGNVYAISVGVLAIIVTFLYQLVLLGRFRERGRPRWPWERDEDD